MSQHLFTKNGMRASCVAALFAIISVGIAQAAAFPQAAADTPTVANPTPPAAPPKPFFARLSVNSTAKTAGPKNGKLIITSITVTNFSASAQQVYVFTAIFASGGHCGDTAAGGADPSMYIEVQPTQTITIPFPSGWVFHGLNPNCVAVSGGPAEAYLVGYTQ